jgi:hypothetical protein
MSMSRCAGVPLEANNQTISKHTSIEDEDGLRMFDEV